MSTRKPAAPSPSAIESWAGSADEWGRRRLNNVECPSGMRIVLQSVTLDELAAEDALPDDLLVVALLETTPGGVTGARAELLKLETPEGVAKAQKLSQDLVGLTNRLVLRAVVEPKLTLAQASTIDPYDKAMIVGIATRRLEFDAAGRRVGVEPLDTFATFREEHGCPEECPACSTSRDRLSTVHGG